MGVETIPVAKSHLSVNLYPRNCGVMMLEIGAQDFALPIAKIGNKFVLLYKILVMDAQQNPYANQKLKTLMESCAHLTQSVPKSVAPTKSNAHKDTMVTNAKRKYKSTAKEPTNMT